MLQRAWILRSLDARLLASFTAWQMACAQATDKKGKPICKKFADLYDYEAELKNIYGEEKRHYSDEERALVRRVRELNRE